ncbi:hypothetical protein [Hymenobacter sp. YC55]|nr:hypothetical protein [Hymenobacter sp. YC55]MDF7815446.1 hypothetical protein [Hymenobacter sp. YC55]
MANAPKVPFEITENVLKFEETAAALAAAILTIKLKRYYYQCADIQQD